MESTVSRRGLIRGAVVTVGAGIAGFAVANNSSYAKAKRATAAANSSGYGGNSGGGRKRLTTLASVPVGGGIILSRQGVVITRDDSGAVHAFSATCTHQGCQVGSIKGGQILCPCH